MNILQLLPKLNVGGVEKGTVEVARYLTLNGHKAVVVSGGGHYVEKLAAIGARHYKMPVGSKNPFVMIRCYFELLRIIKKENIDIIHGRSRIPALIGYLASRRAKRVFVTTAHGQYRKHLISRVMGWGKVVIAANETMARHMKDNFGVPYEKIRIIPRGVDLEKFSFVPRKERPADKFRIGMICRFTPLKGHLDFLKAVSYVARRIPNIEVVLMGDRSSAREEYMKKIGLAIRRLMLDKVVKFVDSDSSVPEVLSTLDVLVSANREQEAFGRSVIEAQARGAVVVATRIGGVVENISDGITGLFCEPMDPLDMSKKILMLADDRAGMEKISVAARRYVEDNFSLKKLMAMTVEVYKSVLQRKSILVFKISALGDIILSIPSLRALRARFRDAVIKVIVDVKFRDVLDGCPYIDEAISCDLRGRDSGAGFFSLASSLRCQDFDVSVDLQNSRKSHMLAYLGGIGERYGYDNGKLSFLLNRKTSMPVEPMPPVEHQSVVLGLLGITSVDDDLELWTEPAAEEWVDAFLDANWVKRDQELIAVNISASERWVSKNWNLQYLVDVVDRLAGEKGIRCVITGTEADREKADIFFAKSGAKAVDAVGRTDIKKLIALMKRCDAVLTGDSAPMHIAAAVKTPFIALFGPTSPEKHMPPGGHGKAKMSRARCAPCYKPVCPKDSRCMKNIRPEEVFNDLVSAMRQGRAGKGGDDGK